jgi:hypothetical protein
MSVFLDGHVRDAQKLLEEKARFRDLEHEYAANHIARLQDNTAQSIETSSLHLDLLSDLKRINSHICSIAYPILESAGALAPGPPAARPGRHAHAARRGRRAPVRRHPLPARACSPTCAGRHPAPRGRQALSVCHACGLPRSACPTIPSAAWCCRAAVRRHAGRGLHRPPGRSRGGAASPVRRPGQDRRQAHAAAGALPGPRRALRCALAEWR